MYFKVAGNYLLYAGYVTKWAVAGTKKKFRNIHRTYFNSVPICRISIYLRIHDACMGNYNKLKCLKT